MTRTTWLLTRSLPLAVGLAVGLGGCAPKENEGASSGAMGLLAQTGQEGDVIVTFEECPAAVQATIRDHLDGGELVEIERTTDHGEVLFEVDVRGDEGIFEFDVAEDGAFRGYEEDGPDEDDDDPEDPDDGDEDDDEEEIPLSEVPQVVKDAAMAAVPGLVLEEASRETEDGTVIYDLEGEADGKEYEIEVTEAGEVLEVEEDKDDDDDD